MSKTIKFIPSSKNDADLAFIEIPKPAKNFIPDWWKTQDYFLNTEDNFDNLSFKACMPFLDTFVSGYMMYTSQDLLVKIENEKPFIYWKVNPDAAVERNSLDNIPVPTGHNKTHFAWKMHFGFELPKGYSLLITHPLNRFDLPFTTVSGIVDESVPWGGKFSFWLKDGFQGIIPKGTPIAQIIPFKRDSWKSEKADYLIENAKNKEHERGTIFYGYYKKFIHKKKKFE
jgi:hypothetical protein